MKKTLLLILIVLSAVASCTKAPINGTLEGLWQLTRIETSADTIETRQYWAFQLHLLQLGNKHFYGRFEHRGGTLRVYDMVIGEVINPSGVDKDGEVECLVGDSTLPMLHPFGIFSLDTHFEVECLDDDRMRLRSDSACLHFRKY